MTAKQTDSAAANPKKIPVYPDNLMPIAADPRGLSPAPRMAGFVFLILLIAALWQHIHISVSEKQDRLSGIYTLAFFQMEKESRTPQEQADEALDILRNIPGIAKAELLDARSMPAFQDADTKTALPALVHIKTAAAKDTVFLQKMGELSAHFPAAQLRDHSRDTQVAALQTRYAHFLTILNISAAAGVTLIIVAMLAAAPKWLRPQQDTIALLRVLGAEDKMILYVFSRQTLRSVLKGLAAGAALAAGLFLIPAYLLSLFGLLPAAVKIDPPVLGLVLAFSLGLFYIAARLRTKHILRRQIWDAA